MPNRLISDAAIEALIAGEPIVGAPESLSAFVASLREHADRAPSVPMSGRLLQFLVDGAPVSAPLTAIMANQTALAPSRRTGRLVGKAAALLAVIPAHLLVGATIAAAALGGVQALGVVDVPLLPDPGPSVETVAPPELAPVATQAPASTVDAVVATTAPTAAVSAENQTTPPGSRPVDDAPRERPESPGRQTMSSTLPSQAGVAGKPGCEFGQQTAQSAPPPAQQPVTSEVTHALEPCEQKPSGGDTPKPNTRSDRGNDPGDDRSQSPPSPGTATRSSPETDNRPTSTDRHGIRQGRTPSGG